METLRTEHWLEHQGNTYVRSIRPGRRRKWFRSQYPGGSLGTHHYIEDDVSLELRFLASDTSMRGQLFSVWRASGLEWQELASILIEEMYILYDSSALLSSSLAIDDECRGDLLVLYSAPRERDDEAVHTAFDLETGMTITAPESQAAIERDLYRRHFPTVDPKEERATALSDAYHEAKSEGRRWVGGIHI